MLAIVEQYVRKSGYELSMKEWKKRSKFGEEYEEAEVPRDLSGPLFSQEGVDRD